LLLIWVANQIKLYACCIKLGIQPEEQNKVTVKLDDLHKISLRTKVGMQRDLDKRITDDKANKQTAIDTKKP